MRTTTSGQGAITAVLLLASVSLTAGARADDTAAAGDGDAGRLLRYSSAWSLLVWPAGSTLSGCFFAGDRGLRGLAAAAAAEWSAIANIRFDFGRAPGYRDCDAGRPSDVRVAFRPDAGGQARVGTRALEADPGRPTVYIGFGPDIGVATRSASELKGTMLHEFGHVLGLPHEHTHADSPCPGEFRLAELCGVRGAAIAADLGEQQQHLVAFMQGQMARRVGAQTHYDVASIMHYRFHAALLRSGAASRCHSLAPRALSAGDAERMARLYPADPAQQRDMLVAEARSLVAAVAADGLPRAVAERMASLAGRQLARRFPDLDAAVALPPLPGGADLEPVPRGMPPVAPCL